MEENKKIKEKYKEYEEKGSSITNVEEENKKLNIINTEMNNKNKELQNELSEIKKKLAKYVNKENQMSENKKTNKNKNDENGLEENDDDNELVFDEDDERNRQLYLDRIKNRNFLSPEERKLKEERLKNIFKKKVFEMKDYLHRNFMKFYYNGIFIQMKSRMNEEKPKKVVKSTHFSNLLNKFNKGGNNNNNTTTTTNVVRDARRHKTISPAIANDINANSEFLQLLQKRGTMINALKFD